VEKEAQGAELAEIWVVRQMAATKSLVERQVASQVKLAVCFERAAQAAALAEPAETC